MLSHETVRAAFDVLCQAATRVKPGSDKWTHVVGAAGVLGWVLDLPSYAENTEELLKVLKNFVRGPSGDDN